MKSICEIIESINKGDAELTESEMILVAKHLGWKFEGPVSNERDVYTIVR